jgi:uncharacterized phage protein gp47/JayE
MASSSTSTASSTPALTTSVPQIQFLSTGLLVPPASAILTGVQADINAALGGDVNPQLTTPQGQLGSSQTAILAANYAVFAEFVNQIDPDNADGFMQDAIARIYFLDRDPGAGTVVQCVCIGAVGTPIPVNAQAQDTSGNLYLCTQAGQIPPSGTITLPFVNAVAGPIACPAGTLNQIFQQIPGWDTVNNPADGVVGSLVETRAAFEARRADSVALNAHGSPDAILAAVLNVPGVLDAYVIDNFESATVNTGSTNFPIPGKSVYVAATGGTAAAIAAAIFSKKDLGCGMTGNTSFTLTAAGFSPPAPQYTYQWETPAPLPILFAVQIANSSTLPTNIVALVQAAIIASFTGTDGSTRVRIGSLLLASKFYAGVANIGAEVSVISILLGSATPTLNSQLIGIDQQPTITAANISVTLV